MMVCLPLNSVTKNDVNRFPIVPPSKMPWIGPISLEYDTSPAIEDVDDYAATDGAKSEPKTAIARVPGQVC